MDQEIGKTSLLVIKNYTLPPTETLICRQYIALGRHTSLALHNFCLFVCFLFSACRKPDVMLTQISKRFSCGSTDLGLTPKPLGAMGTSQAVHFCPELCESSGKQLNKWSCSCTQINHCVQKGSRCRSCPVLQSPMFKTQAAGGPAGFQEACQEGRSYRSKFILHRPLWAPRVGFGEDFIWRGRGARPRLTAFKSLFCRHWIHMCIKIITAAYVCSFKLHSTPLIHTSGKTIGNVWLQWLQSTAWCPHSHCSHRRGLILSL